MQHLTSFQRDCLYVIAGSDTPLGKDVARMLTEYYEGEISNQRVYYNKAVLIEEGYIDTSEGKGQAEPLELTEKGQQSIIDRRCWEDSYIELTGEWAEDSTASVPSITEYTAAQRDVMYIVGRDELSLGMDVTRELDAYRLEGAGKSITIKSLAEMVEQGMVERRDLDGTHTEYNLTEEGVRALEARRAWESQYVNPCC